MTLKSVLILTFAVVSFTPREYLQGMGHWFHLPVSCWGLGLPGGRRILHCKAQKDEQGQQSHSTGQADMESKQPAGEVRSDSLITNRVSKRWRQLTEIFRQSNNWLRKVSDIPL